MNECDWKEDENKTTCCIYYYSDNDMLPESGSCNAADGKVIASCKKPTSSSQSSFSNIALLAATAIGLINSLMLFYLVRRLNCLQVGEKQALSGIVYGKLVPIAESDLHSAFVAATLRQGPAALCRWMSSKIFAWKAVQTVLTALRRRRRLETCE